MKKTLLLGFFFAFVIQNMAFSQGKTNVDSLINVAEKYLAEDTIQIKRWITISKLLYASNPQKGLESADKALVLAQKIGHAGFTADAYLLKGAAVED